MRHERSTAQRSDPTITVHPKENRVGLESEYSDEEGVRRGSERYHNRNRPTLERGDEGNATMCWKKSGGGSPLENETKKASLARGVRTGRSQAKGGEAFGKGKSKKSQGLVAATQTRGGKPG